MPAEISATARPWRLSNASGGRDDGREKAPVAKPIMWHAKPFQAINR
jgi:hypothetical protein